VRTRSNVTCSVCRSPYDESEWLALDLADRVDASEVSRFVVGWSPRECVEVRLCRSCGHRIAMRREVRDEGR
jgi:hypothetical protein